MKFKKLSTSQKDLIIQKHTQTELSREEAQDQLAKAFGVTSRSIRTWARKLGLTNLESMPTVDAEIVQPSPAKILVFDIETAPLRSYVWGIWNVNLGHNMSMVKADWFMLTWSAKWLFEDEVFADRLTPEEVKVQDDSRIVKSMWELINEADVVIAHNGLKFDIKRLNTRFLIHGLNPPMPYQVIDTLIHCRRQFNITSNKLDYIGKFLGLGKKFDTGGFELWDACMNGDPAALEKMEVYNIQDVRLLEAVYLKIRPYIKPHPNMGLFIEDNISCCPTCSSTQLTWGGSYATYANVFDAFRCNNCGAVGRSRKSNIPIRSRSALTISTP